MFELNPSVKFSLRPYCNSTPPITLGAGVHRRFTMAYWPFLKALGEEAFELSKDIPLLVGTVKNEFMASVGNGLTNAPIEKVTEFIKKQRGDKADAFIAAVKKAYPNDTKPSDLIDVDAMFRPGAVLQAKEKAGLNAAPVYMYLFTWQSPVMDL